MNGAHTTETLQELVSQFVTKFVLCPTCNLPETTLSIKHKKGEIWHKCAACGNKNMVDMSHKLCALILKEAKNAKKENEDNAEDPKSKKERREDRDARKAAERAKKEEEEEKEKEKKKKEKEEKKRKKKEEAESAGAEAVPAVNTEAITEEAAAIEKSWLRLREVRHVAPNPRSVASNVLIPLYLFHSSFLSFLYSMWMLIPPYPLKPFSRRSLTCN